MNKHPTEPSEALELARAVRSLVRAENSRVHAARRLGVDVSECGSRDEADMIQSDIYANWPAKRLDALIDALAMKALDPATRTDSHANTCEICDTPEACTSGKCPCALTAEFHWPVPPETANKLLAATRTDIQSTDTVATMRKCLAEIRAAATLAAAMGEDEAVWRMIVSKTNEALTPSQSDPIEHSGWVNDPDKGGA